MMLMIIAILLFFLFCLWLYTVAMVIKDAINETIRKDEEND